MSGSGRKSSYRKGVTDAVLYGEPEPKENEQIVQVTTLRGSNLFSIITKDGVESVAMLPHKYRKLIWIKRSDFVIVSGADSDITTTDGKKGAVQFMIEHILYKDQIKSLKEKNLWPTEFMSTEGEEGLKQSTSASTTEVVVEDHTDLFVNRNRMGGYEDDDESEEYDTDE